METAIEPNLFPCCHRRRWFPGRAGNRGCVLPSQRLAENCPGRVCDYGRGAI